MINLDSSKILDLILSKMYYDDLGQFKFSNIKDIERMEERAYIILDDGQKIVITIETR